MYRRLCETLGLTSLATDPRFETNTLRVENRKILDDELRPVIEGYQSEDQLRTIQGTGVAVCGVNSARDIYEDHHPRERGKTGRETGREMVGQYDKHSEDDEKIKKKIKNDEYT